MFARLEACAVAGERCPTRDDGLHPGDVTALAHGGQIAIEVSSRNWRRVTILTGPHAGKSTKANPIPNASIYMTLDKSGTRIRGKAVDSGKGTRQQPSKPGLIPYAGKD